MPRIFIATLALVAGASCGPSDVPPLCERPEGGAPPAEWVLQLEGQPYAGATCPEMVRCSYDCGIELLCPSGGACLDNCRGMGPATEATRFEALQLCRLRTGVFDYELGSNEAFCTFHKVSGTGSDPCASEQLACESTDRSRSGPCATLVRCYEDCLWGPGEHFADCGSDCWAAAGSAGQSVFSALRSCED